MVCSIDWNTMKYYNLIFAVFHLCWVVIGFEFDHQSSKVNSCQKYFCCLKAHIIISYLIFEFKVLKVWPWPLTSKGHLGSSKNCIPFEGHLGSSKNCIPFESQYMASYLTSMDTISLSCNVFELFNFEFFRVWPWPWPLTSEDHLGSKSIPFERQCMTFYLTSMDNISPSRTVFEIFDFKVFRVWPWPMTPKGHLGSKTSMPFESPYIFSYLTSLNNISLFRTVFKVFDFKIFRVWPWSSTPKGHLGWKNFYTI